MKILNRSSLVFLISPLLALFASAQTTLTLNPLASFGPNGDGSIRPGQSIGLSPVTGNDVQISAPGGFGIQTGDSVATPTSTNGFNMRGLAVDPVSGNVLLVDTHTGQNGSQTNVPNSGIYILDPDSGNIISSLTTNITTLNSLAVTNLTAGIGVFSSAGVADDGVVYVANQVNAANSANAFRIWRWPTANPSNPGFTNVPSIAFSGTLGLAERVGETVAVRGAGTNTQIIISSASTTFGTNLWLFTTANGTNFVQHRFFVPGVTNAAFNDGIAFGPGNTFWTKQVGQPFYYLAFDGASIVHDVASTNACTLIAKYAPSSANDPLLNISAIAVDNVNHVLAGMEEIGGTATGGHGKVWIFRISDPTNHAPSVLANRVYISNFQKTTAPMGYLAFRNNRLYANASNNGLLVNTVDSAALSAPTFVWADYNSDGSSGTRNGDLPAATRAAVGLNVHFEGIAAADITNYQWYSNNVPIAGANSYSYDLPNVTTNASGSVFRVVAFNAAGSANSTSSTLTVVNPSSFFNPIPLWSKVANAALLSDPTNFITSGGGSGTPNERTIAYCPQSNALIVVRGLAPASITSMKIFVLDADTGNFLYTLKTNGITTSTTINLVGVGVADDGAVYAVSVGASTVGSADASLKVYRWADAGSNTLPQLIWGTNSPAANANMVGDLVGSQFYRFGDALAVRGSGTGTEIIMDAGNPTKYVGILHPTDSTMTNWTQSGYLLQNLSGSYGSEAYGTGIGRSIQFGQGNTFWQKRYNAAAGAPLARMSYTPGSAGISALVTVNSSAELFTNGPVAINSTLNVAAGINFVGAVGSDQATVGGTVDVLDYFDVTDPSQAVLLTRVGLPGGNSNVHKANANAIGQVVFGINPTTQTNYIFVLNGNNGVAAFTLSGGVTPPPKILAQPRNLRVLQASSGSLGISVDQLASIQWYKGTNAPVYTGTNGSSFPVNNAQLSDAGDYFAVVSNANGTVTSQSAHLSVSLPNDNYTLSPTWSAGAGDPTFPYISSNGGANTPNERAFAFNAPSNQLIVVRCPPGSTAYTVSVVSATSGAFLYTLNTTGVLHQGASEVSGANPIDLVGAAASDDGSIYICSESPNASGGLNGDTNKMLQIYRWTNSAASTPPVIVFTGDPSKVGAGINARWGDVLTARGSGAGTELFLNSFDGGYGAILKPADGSLNAFTNFPFLDASGGGSIGRSVQFGTNNTVFEKRKGSSLVFSTYDTNAQNATATLTIDSSTTLGGVAVDTAHNLAVGVDFVGSSSKPDAVAVYDISVPSSPMLLKRYNYPSNQVANANVICQTIISGNRVFALDANNGLMLLNIIPPANSMTLSISPAGSNVSLSWGNSQAILQGSPTVSPTTWTDLVGPGLTNSVQPASSNMFYRLIQRF